MGVPCTRNWCQMQSGFQGQMGKPPRVARQVNRVRMKKGSRVEVRCCCQHPCCPHAHPRPGATRAPRKLAPRCLHSATSAPSSHALSWCRSGSVPVVFF